MQNCVTFGAASTVVWGVVCGDYNANFSIVGRVVLIEGGGFEGGKIESNCTEFQSHSFNKFFLAKGPNAADQVNFPVNFSVK